MSIAYGHCRAPSELFDAGYVRGAERYSEPVNVVWLYQHCVAILSLASDIGGLNALSTVKLNV